jgi:alpha-L-rhamnosidase
VRLQALANYVTFGDKDLAKRCLYLFAATPYTEQGHLSASIFEKPHICSGGQSIADYTQIYAATLKDYVEFTGDVETGRDLFGVALKQFELSVARCDPETGLYVPNAYEMSDSIEKKDRDVTAQWHFIDCASQTVTP